MTLSPTNTYKNIKASIERYVFDGLNSVITIDWQNSKGVDLENEDEWLSPRILRGWQEYAGEVSNSTKGNITEFMLNMNIFLRKNSTTNAHRLFELRDIVAQYFEINQEIAIKDYDTAGNPISDIFIIREIITDMEVPMAGGGIAGEKTQLFYQYNYTPLLKLISQF